MKICHLWSNQQNVHISKHVHDLVSYNLFNQQLLNEARAGGSDMQHNSSGPRIFTLVFTEK